MSWAAVGSEFTLTSGSATQFTFAPSASGNTAFFIVTGESATVYANGITSTNATWTLVDHFLGTNTAFYISIFQATATSASSATATITWSGTTPAASSVRAGGFAFHSSVGSWGSPTAVRIDSSTNTWPASGTAGLYFGWAYNNNTQAASTTSGFTSSLDGNGNPWAYDLVATASSAPVFPDTAGQLGFVVGLADTVTSTGSVSLARMAAGGSGAETVSATGSVSLASMAAHGAGAESIASSGSVSMSTMGATGAGAVATNVSATGSLALSSMSAAASGGVTSTVHGTVEGGTLGASGSALVALSHLTLAGSAAGGVTRVRGALVVVEATPPPPVLRQPPTVNNWLSGDALDAAGLNTYVRDTFMYLAAPPLLRVQQNAVQSGIPTAQWTVVTLQSVAEDTYSGWSPAWNIGNAYQAQVPGWYSLTLNVSADVPSGALGRVGFWYWSAANGVYVGPIEFGQQVVGPGASYWTWHAYDETYLQVDDLVLPMFYHQAGVAVGSDLSSPSSFEVAWISS